VSLVYHLIGLGNEGKEYEKTRHNVGRECVNFLRERWGGKWERKKRWRVAEGVWQNHTFRFVQFRGYMNESGVFLKEYLESTGVKGSDEEIFLFHDDVDLPFGKVRLKKGGNPAGHHGVESIYQIVGKRFYPRVRIGIGKPLRKGDMVNYVLSPFFQEEAELLPFLFETIGKALIIIFEENWERGVSYLHSFSLMGITRT